MYKPSSSISIKNEYSQNAINEAEKAVKIAVKFVKDTDKEHLIGIYLDARNFPKKAELISLGIINGGLVHPREVFYPAIECKACSVIVLHNHPSGDVNGSLNDIRITKRLKQAGEILGIELVDHIVFDKKGKEYQSLINLV